MRARHRQCHRGRETEKSPETGRERGAWGRERETDGSRQTSVSCLVAGHSAEKTETFRQNPDAPDRTFKLAQQEFTDVQTPLIGCRDFTRSAGEPTGREADFWGKGGETDEKRRGEPSQEEDERTGGEGEEAGEKREDFLGLEFGVCVFSSFPSPSPLPSGSVFPFWSIYVCFSEALDVKLDGCFKRHRRQCLLYL